MFLAVVVMTLRRLWLVLAWVVGVDLFLPEVHDIEDQILRVVGLHLAWLFAAPLGGGMRWSARRSSQVKGGPGSLPGPGDWR